MESLPTDALAGSAVAPSAIDQEILRLQQERDKLLARREAVRHEMLQNLADAFARKLHAAGFTVREGIQALRPYANVKLKVDMVERRGGEGGRQALQRAPTRTSGGGAAAQPLPSAQQSIESYAQQVLGTAWKEWLDQPNLLLGGERPNGLLGSRAGLAKVRALLEAFEQGAELGGVTFASV